MYLIVGLGNPGKEYEKTRHNMGYDVLDRIAKNYNLEFKKKKLAYEARAKIYGKDCILIKPTTYMNLSGDAVSYYMNYYKIRGNDVVVVHDEKDFLPGIVKIRKGGGSSAGHKGIKSIQQYTNDFIRVRIGIGRPDYAGDIVPYVIGKVTDEEYDMLYDGVILADKMVTDIIKNGVDHAMNKYNKRSNKKKEEDKE